MLICRNYKGDVDMAEIDHFLPLLMTQEEEGLTCPIMSHGNVHFLWIKHTNLYCILIMILVASQLKVNHYHFVACINHVSFTNEMLVKPTQRQICIFP